MAAHPLRSVTSFFAGTLFACSLALFLPSPLLADSLTLAPLEPAAEAPAATESARKTTTWKLSADTLNSLGDNTIIEASGDVILRSEGSELKADFARYYTETGWTYLKGNVFVSMDGDTLSASEAEFDLRGQTGWLYNGSIFIAGPHMYASGEKIIKHSADRYSFEQAKITTCDGDRPAWSVSSRAATVEIDGYATLYGASVAVKNLDVAYTPFILLPIKTTRQAGLLPPDMGYSKKRGTTYTQPFYWPISDTRDVTFYTSFMSHVGGGLGLEYRSMPTTRQKTWLAFSGISDRRDDLDSSGNRTNDSRYWLRGMGDGDLGNSGWQYKFNLDYASDQKYLQDFSGGPMGFDASYDALYRMFGRTLKKENKNRVSEGLLFRDWDRVGLAASFRYEQDPRYGHDGLSRSRDTLVQRLPQLDAFLYKGTVIPGLPLEAEARFTSGYMYRRAGTSGLRTEFSPRISLPLDFKYLSVIPAIGLTQTWYSNTSIDHSARFRGSKNPASNPNLDGTSRTVPDIDIQAFTELNRIWNLDNPPFDPTVGEQGFFAGWTGLRHDIQPRLRYRYTRKIDQDDNPYFEESDRLLPVSELTYSITNILTRKKVSLKKKLPANGTPGVDVPLAAKKRGEPADNTAQNAQAVSANDTDISYLDILRWKLEWGYDFNEARRTMHRTKFERRPMTDILSELTLHPVPWFSASSRTYYSPYAGKLTRHDHSLTFTVSDWLAWTTGIEYRNSDYNLRSRLRYEDLTGVPLTNPVHLFKNRIRLRVNPQWALAYHDYRNLRRDNGSGWRGKGYDKGLEVSYTAQCYRLFFRFNDDGYDKSYSVMFDIPGLFDSSK